MILVTGVAGKTGRAVIRALDPLDEPVRALYHVGPNVHPGELEMGRCAIGAAREAGVERFVYHSVLHPQIEAMPHHWKKLRAEERLLASGLAFTVLRPAAYMQNLLAHRGSIREEGVYPIPYAPDTRIAMVDLADVAEVAARALAEDGHEGATYELCGTEPLPETAVAGILGEELGSRVELEEIPRPEWRARARERGMDPYRVETLAAMFEYYERHGFAGNDRVLGTLLGRPPTSLREFMGREVA